MHWDVSAEHRGTVLQVPDEIKAMIREHIPTALADRSSRVRSAVAYVISTIAELDWPDKWPTLFHTLTEAISSDNACAVHGGMRVLKGTLWCQQHRGCSPSCPQ